VPGYERVEDVRAYYQKILPFYEKESIARAHLAFWRGFARRWRPARILEIGAGLGRITGALSRHAPSVGIDISLEMLERASRRLPARSLARFVAADMRRAVFGCQFDLIVAPNDPFSHLTSAADRRQALCAVARQLSARGHFVLEGLYRGRKGFELPERKIRHESGVLSISETWLPLGAHQLWRARYFYRDRRPGEWERALSASFVGRAWDPRDIRRFFSSCGLAIEELWGDFDRRPFWRGARRIVVVARRVITKGGGSPRARGIKRA
jgi:SAM-dependent methyltransferase